MKARLLFSKVGDVLPAPGTKVSPEQKNEAANINPFTPSTMVRTWDSLDCSSQSDEFVSDLEEGRIKLLPPTKRVRISDMNVSRYQVGCFPFFLLFFFLTSCYIRCLMQLTAG